LVGRGLGAAAFGVARFFREPPVFSYDPIIGFFPGNLYDEDVALGAPLYWARLETLCEVAALCALVAAGLDAPTLTLRRGRGRRPSGVRTGGLAVCAAFVLAAGALRRQAGPP